MPDGYFESLPIPYNEVSSVLAEASADSILALKNGELKRILTSDMANAIGLDKDYLLNLADKIKLFTFNISEAITDTVILSVLNENNSTFAGSNQLSIIFIVSSVGDQKQAVIVHTQSVNYGGAKAVGYFSASDYTLASGTWSKEDYLPIYPVEKTLNISNASGYFDIDVTRAGARAVGVVGYLGSGSTGFMWNDMYVMNGNTVRVYYTRTGTATLTKFTVHVLYKKNV